MSEVTTEDTFMSLLKQLVTVLGRRDDPQSFIWLQVIEDLLLHHILGYTQQQLMCFRVIWR